MNKEDLKSLIKNIGNQLYELFSNVVCSICQELLTRPVTTPCGHSFCSGCIKRVLSSRDNNGCPLCKNPVKRYGLEEDKVKLTLSKICQELPAAFAEDVKELTADLDLEDFGESLIKTSKLSQYHQELNKDTEVKCTNKKSSRGTAKRIAKVQENDSESFTPVLKRSKNIQEYASAKRKRVDDLMSVSQTEPASTSSSFGEPTELDKNLQKIEKIPPEEKVKEWFNAVGDNIYINSPVSECDKKEIDRPALVKRDYTKEERKTDPYEFIPSQSIRKKPKRTSRRIAKKIPDFEALQCFSRENLKRSKMVQETMEEVEDDRVSPVEMKRVTASQKFDQLLSETKHKSHALYSASKSSSPNFLDVSLHSKLEEEKSPGSKLDDILFKDMEIVEERGKRKRISGSKRRKTLFKGKKKQTKLEELLQELVNDDIIYGTQPADAPVRLPDVECANPEVRKSPKLDSATQKSVLIGFDAQEEILDEVMFKKMVENMERELNSEVIEDIPKAKEESFVAFNLLGKIRQSKSTFIEFLLLGRLTPTRTRTRSTVVKVVFPIGLASLARRRRRTTRREVSIGIQTSQRMVSSVAQTSQIEQSSATIQTSQEEKPSVEIQTTHKWTASAEIQTTQRQVSCEVQTTQIGCSEQVQTTQRLQSCEVQTTQIGHSIEVQTTQIGQAAEVQATQQDIQSDVEKSTSRKPVHTHRKVISEVTSPSQLFSNDELDLEMEFNKAWQKTQKPEVSNKDDSEDSDIQPVKRRSRVLSPDSIPFTEVIEKYEIHQKIPLDVRKVRQVEEDVEVIHLGTQKKSEESQNSEAQMLKVLNNINLDLTKCKKDEAKGEKSEESDSDVFVEQTPPKKQWMAEHASKAKEKNVESPTKEKTLESADVIGDSLPKGFSESFLMLTVPEKPDENDQNQLNSNRETETKASQLKAVVNAWKRTEPKTGKKLCVVASSIKNPEMVRKFTARFKIEYLSKPTKDMTHLIVGLHKNEEMEELPLCTPKLLFAIANKKWVVCEKWAETCLKMNVILPEENFETLDPGGGCGCKKARLSTEKLLKNCEIYLLGSFQTISKEEFADLIIDCGGTIIPTPEKFSYLPSRLRMIVADRDCLKLEDAQIQELYEKHSTVVLSRDVIIMSIQSYTLANLSSYLLHRASENTLVKLGYPLELVRNEDDEEEMGEGTPAR